MKRSEINAHIARAEADFRRAGLALPPFAAWTADDWAAAGEAARGLVDTGCGWDVTDFGGGDFARRGLLLFTARNGRPEGGDGNRPYAEKIMISRRDQLTPMHRHVHKVEDIINRASLDAGATLGIKLFEAGPDGAIDKTRVVVAHLDGLVRHLDPGTVVHLRPGESITLFPGTFHAFWGEGGDVVIGEVSSVNDDATDNYFAEPLDRFSSIEEDEPVTRPLVNDRRLP
ncbi:D-lyxose/D-mannose family sugar isomerase [Chthonobacter rhizosphaerae]|uniref:D-lyxose/D-mannose family sugar isomerase n=1 Tax=Chthonobacter rhizosphaerae TaxID=2735553 RepID=UPI0015EF42C9|nr:D-lyxose/D-mannose family sugar isomerase [Chthonobacter rhizosphaerae]